MLNRASTEFTGWPSPSTTPFSIEKLLELQRNATSTTPLPEVSTETTTRRIFSTTTTTTVPPQPTTPGICRYECDIAGTIKIVSGNSSAFVSFCSVYIFFTKNTYYNLNNYICRC